jgi:hypothetical protein
MSWFPEATAISKRTGARQASLAKTDEVCGLTTSEDELIRELTLDASRVYQPLARA